MSTNELVQTGSESVHKSDSSVYTILKFDTTDKRPFSNAKPTSLTQTEINQIETILNGYIDRYNKKERQRFDSLSEAHPEYQLKPEDFIITLTQYKRQYLPIINSDGQKEVWINCFCGDSFEDWKREIVIVNDGGNCFFNLIINLHSKSVYRFIVNGEA